ncbi:MAG: 4-hydroxy-tetrahydrodipicolinate synthase [Proteobacteria bacterium SG_bin7]|nr:MAG: 4-hydroxy-tetrahydrodipicolinate synthase [Proteobacteria bacterium SG_bin7]
MICKGIITAIITPFKKGEIDYSSLRKLIRFQLESGVDGIVVAGTTGESPTLSLEEKEEVFKFIKSEVAGEVSVIMGTGSNSTKETVSATKKAEKWGADAALVVVPYYNKPPQEGLYQHFEKVAENTRLPIILYNVPGRTVTSLSVETIIRLSEISNVVGIKEATGDIKMTEDILKRATKDFYVLSGDDATYLDLYDVGAEGVISVLSNILPKETKNWAKNHGKKKVLEEFEDYKKFVNALFAEVNPIPIKMALYWRGLIASPELRLPLVELSENSQALLKKEMKRLEIL